MQRDIKITKSSGRGKFWQQYYYVRPAFKCSNKSRRCKAEDLDKCIEKYFAPRLRKFEIEGLLIGAPEWDKAIAEYNRVCSKKMIGKAKYMIEVIDFVITP